LNNPDVTILSETDVARPLVRGDLTRYCSVTTSARRPCGLPCPGRVAFAGEPPVGVV